MNFVRFTNVIIAFLVVSVCVIGFLFVYNIVLNKLSTIDAINTAIDSYFRYIIYVFPISVFWVLVANIRVDVIIKEYSSFEVKQIIPLLMGFLLIGITLSIVFYLWVVPPKIDIFERQKAKQENKLISKDKLYRDMMKELKDGHYDRVDNILKSLKKKYPLNIDLFQVEEFISQLKDASKNYDILMQKRIKEKERQIKLLMKKGMYFDAFSKSEELLIDDPNNSIAKRTIARVQRIFSSFSLRYRAKMYLARNNYINKKIEYAIWLYNKKRYNEAYRIFKVAAAIYPDDKEIANYLEKTMAAISLNDFLIEEINVVKLNSNSKSNIFFKIKQNIYLIKKLYKAGNEYYMEDIYKININKLNTTYFCYGKYINGNIIAKGIWTNNVLMYDIKETIPLTFDIELIYMSNEIREGKKIAYQKAFGKESLSDFLLVATTTSINGFYFIANKVLLALGLFFWFFAFAYKYAALYSTNFSNVRTIIIMFIVAIPILFAISIFLDIFSTTLYKSGISPIKGSVLNSLVFDVIVILSGLFMWLKIK